MTATGRARLRCRIGYSDRSNDPPLDDECEPRPELAGWTEGLCWLTGAGASTGKVGTAAAGVVVALGASEASSASGLAGIAALNSPPPRAVCTGASGPDARVAIPLGRLPTIGGPPRSPPGIAARGENAPCAEDGSCPDVASEPCRPITKKQPKTTAAVTSSAGHRPFMLAC